MRPLSGTRVIELAGLAPAPYAGMILADFGADVIRIDRAPTAGSGADPIRDALARGKRSIGLNLKSPRGIEVLMRLISQSDVLLEPFRPGVMEKLGIGPEPVLAARPSLVYARLTGWGQNGSFAAMAGHDINYIALSGALSLFGRKGEKPIPPVNLLGDFAGGGMLCAMGIMLALLERANSGKGQVVDAAMVDGAANLATFIYGFHSAGFWKDRGTNMLDTGAPFYDTYETQDGKYMSVGAIEPQFYAKLLEGLGLTGEELPHQMDQSHWGEMAERFTTCFLGKTRDQWCEIFDGTDACVAPVLDLEEAKTHPHNLARNLFSPAGGGSSLPSPAPALSRTPGDAAPAAPVPGSSNSEVFEELGFTEAEIATMTEAGDIG